MPENIFVKNTENYIFASLLTGIYDVNRNELLKENDFENIKKWYNSILSLKLNAIIFHNSFSKEIIEKYSNKYIKFIKVEYNGKLKPNIFRYFIYNDYIKQNSAKIKNIFITDITDVEVLQNPFETDIFKNNADYLFCGDEPEILDTIWMRNHCTHLRNLMPAFGLFELANKHKTLLNCGIIGGNMILMQLLLTKITSMHETFSYSNTTPYTLDMGVFNYVSRTTFSNKIFHGEPVNTIFKEYQTIRTDCWFRHK